MTGFDATGTYVSLIFSSLIRIRNKFQQNFNNTSELENNYVGLCQDEWSVRPVYP